MSKSKESKLGGGEEVVAPAAEVIVEPVAEEPQAVELSSQTVKGEDGEERIVVTLPDGTVSQSIL